MYYYLLGAAPQASSQFCPCWMKIKNSLYDLWFSLIFNISQKYLWSDKNWSASWEVISTYKLLIRGLWWHISCGIVRIWDRSNRIDSNFSVPFKFGNWDTVLASEMSSFCRLGKLMKASGWIVLIGFIFNSINFKSGQFWRRPSGTSSTWFSPISRYCRLFK